MINYHLIVLDIKEKITSGEWPPYLKIPTQNELSKKYNVNRSTIVKAIDELKSLGYLKGIQGSGTFVSSEIIDLRLKQATIEWENISKWSFFTSNKKLVRKINDLETNSNFIQLSKGVLGKEYIPKKIINEALQNAASKEISHDYGNGAGDIELRKYLSYFMKKKGINVSYESILIVSGALNGIQLIASSILQTGSKIYIEQFSFLNTLNFFHSLGIRTVPLDFNEEREIEKIEPNQTIYINSPFQNPTTQTLSRKQEEDILDASNRKSIPIIEDNIYGDLTYQGVSKPLKSQDKNGNVIYVSSFSKTLSPSLRIGWIVAAPDIIKKISDVRMHTDYGTSSISQAVCTELLKSGEYENHLIHLRDVLKERRDFFGNLLNKYLSKYGEFSLPEGGFFIWFTFYSELNIPLKELFRLCIQDQVLINPSIIYGDQKNHSIRFSFVYEGKENLEKGVSILAKHVQNLVSSPTF